MDTIKHDKNTVDQTDANKVEQSKVKTVKQAKDEIDAFYNYYKDLLEWGKDNPLGFTGVDEMGNSNSLDSQIYMCVFDYYAREQCPTPMSDDEFYNNDKKPIYHGFHDIKHAGQMLCNRNKHYGHGVLGHGFYTTNKFSEATSYTGVNNNFNRIQIDDNSNLDRERTVEFKLDTNNVVEKHDIERAERYLKDGNEEHFDKIRSFSYGQIERLKWLKSKFDEKNDPEFKDMITRNSAIVAIILGFDAILSEHYESSSKHYIVVQPSKLQISTSEYNRVLEKAGSEFSQFIIREQEQ